MSLRVPESKLCETCQNPLHLQNDSSPGSPEGWYYWVTHMGRTFLGARGVVIGIAWLHHYPWNRKPEHTYTMGPISLNTQSCIAKIARLLTNLLPRITFVSTLWLVAVFPISKIPLFSSGPPLPTQMLCLSIKLSRKLCRQQQVVKTMLQTSMTWNRMPFLSTLQHFFRIPSIVLSCLLGYKWTSFLDVRKWEDVSMIQ